MHVRPIRSLGSVLPWLAGLGVALAYLARFTSATADPDLFAYLSFGRLLWSNFRTGLGFPWHDVFSYLPVKDLLVYHEWLTGALFFRIYELFGWSGLQVVRFAALAATLGLVWWTAGLRIGRTGHTGHAESTDRAGQVEHAEPACRLAGMGVLISLACLYLAKDLIRIGYGPVRAQVITFLFFALTIHLLERDRLAEDAPASPAGISSDRSHRPGLRGWSPLWLMVPTCLVWPNLHAGFPAGLGIIALYGLAQGLAGRPWGRHMAVLAASILATLANPYGLATWGFAVETSLVPWGDVEIEEWRSVLQLFRNPEYHGLCLLFLVLAGVAAALALPVLRQLPAWWRDRWKGHHPPDQGADLAPLLVLAATAWLGLTHVRHVVLFGLAFCAYVPALAVQAWAELSRVSDARREARSKPNREPNREEVARDTRGETASSSSRPAVALPALLILLLLADSSIAAFRTLSRQHPLDLRTPSLVEAVAMAPEGSGGAVGFHYPVGAVDFVRLHGLQGRVLTDFAWGNYVTWELYPSCLVAFDNRCGLVYSDRVYDAYFDLHYLRDGWRAFLDDYPPDMVILEANSLLGARLLSTGEWRTVYRDPGCELLLR